MGKTKMLFLVFLFAVISCKEDSSDLEVVKCEIQSSIDMLPDSTFMQDVLQIQFVDNSVFFIETSSRQLIKLQSDFTDNKRIANYGMGPKEIADPWNFVVFNDTIYIADAGNQAIKCYTQDNNFIKSFSVPMHSEERIFVKDHMLYLAACHRELKTPLVKIDLSNDTAVIRFWGESLEFNHPLQNLIRNKRDLLQSGNYFYCISDNRPVIDKYSFDSDSLLQRFDYSFIPIIRDNLKVIESEHSQQPNTYTVFITDSYVYNDNLYLLVCKHGSEYSVNTILKIKLNPEFRVEKTYLLPGNSYSTFCIGNDFIFAFNYQTTSVEKIKLIN